MNFRILTTAIFTATLIFQPPKADATGIPVGDAGVLTAVLQSIAIDVANAAIDQALYQAQMDLDQALSDQFNDLFQRVQSESTWRLIDNQARIHNQEALAASLPPPTACETYNSARNARVAYNNSINAVKEANERNAARSINIGPNATTAQQKQRESYGEIFERFKTAASEGAPPLMVRADNLLRKGEFQGEDTTEEQEQGRKDMLDIVLKANIQQPVDYRRPVSGLSDSDLESVSQYLTRVGRLDIARGAAYEVFGHTSQGESGSPSVLDVMEDFNEKRFLNPAWVSDVFNTTRSQQRFTQPEQIQRELLAIRAYSAFLQEKEFSLNQWNTLMNSIRTAQNVERSR